MNTSFHFSKINGQEYNCQVACFCMFNILRNSGHFILNCKLPTNTQKHPTSFTLLFCHIFHGISPSPLLCDELINLLGVLRLICLPHVPPRSIWAGAGIRSADAGSRPEVKPLTNVLPQGSVCWDYEGAQRPPRLLAASCGHDDKTGHSQIPQIKQSPRLTTKSH